MFMKQIQIEIWSDIMCPFCYIGKRRLEAAIDHLDPKPNLEIQWRSFQLNPNLVDQPKKDMFTYLAELKGQSLEWSIQMHNQLTETAKELGLDYRFDLAKIANSLDAHRIIQLAKTLSLDNDMEERLFYAYFTEGACISDPSLLIRLASDIGIPEIEAKKVLEEKLFTEAIERDLEEAMQLGVRGVPFFVFNRKYAISGAQSTEHFVQVLKKVMED
jgi:protein disulfide-isomerase